MAHGDGDFHERLQRLLFEHALRLLRQGVSVILEDGLWRRSERDDKFVAARQCDAVTELHLLDLPKEEIWRRLEVRNASGSEAEARITRAEFDRIASIFESPDAAELSRFDHVSIH